METNELKKIWDTLAQNKLVNKELARENIRELIVKKGAGLLEKLFLRVKREIIADIVAMSLIVLIMTGVTIIRGAGNIEIKAHIVIGIIFMYFIFKLFRDIRKYRALKMSKLTDSIKSSTLSSYKQLKVQMRQDMFIAILFIVTINLYAIYIYYQAFGNYKEFDFTEININSIGFIILNLLIISVIVVPIIIRIFYKRKYQSVIDDFEATLKELNEETE